MNAIAFGDERFVRLRLEQLPPFLVTQWAKKVVRLQVPLQRIFFDDLGSKGWAGFTPFQIRRVFALANFPRMTHRLTIYRRCHDATADDLHSVAYFGRENIFISKIERPQTDIVGIRPPTSAF